ncbi:MULTISPECIES: acyl-CoA dehydrogenase family protein [Burkholderia]|uniref:acyl-CoA dehydrogenase family protein n=1 Tax=Burkholderia TaxID=32008 RepID=UPI00158D622E|nr:acyl-CoA dehydrogenase family protein [Burkholderia seminalis]
MNDQRDIGVLLAEQLERLFTRQVDPALMVAVERGEPADALWQEIEAQGTVLALADPAAGGAGLDWVTCRAALATTGHHAAPVPLGETMVAAWACAAAGIEPPAGPLAVFTSVLTLDAQNRLTGSEGWLPWACVGSTSVAVGERDGRRWLVLLALDEGDLTPLDSVARMPGARAVLRGKSAEHLVPAPPCIGPLGLLPAMGVLRSIQMAAALDRVLAMTLEYANTRQQFGKPIGRFQAVQHLLADLAGQAAAAQVAALYGCRQFDAKAAVGDRGAAVAKIVTSRAAGIGAAAAHQVFGAIGVTDEHPLHHFTRRLWQWRSEAGSEHFWAEQLGRPLIAVGGAALWPSIAD